MTVAAPWIEAPLALKGNKLWLESLKPEHIDELDALAKDPRIWEFYALDGGNSSVLKPSLEAALIECEIGKQFPFVVVDPSTGRLLGSTRFLDIQPTHRKLEIGWTWLHPDHWASGINTECKYLLLRFCFETAQAVRVQLKTDVKNIRSRTAIQKIGARFEGVLRNDMIRENGSLRDSAYFSVTAQDWPEVKRMLEERLAKDYHPGL